MKKELVIVIIVISFIIIGHVTTQKKTVKVLGEFEESLTNLKGKMLNEYLDKKDIKNDIEKINDRWNEEFDVLALYIEHSQLEKIEQQLILVQTYIEIEDYNMGVVEIDRGKNIIGNIKVENSYRMVNIF